MLHVTVRPAPPARRAEALTLLAAACDDPQLTVSRDEASRHEPTGFPLDGLLIAEAGPRLLGAALYVTQPGGVAFVWPPGVVNDCSPTDVGVRLLDEAARRIDAAGCRLAQCLIEPGSAAASLLERAGFPQLTQLIYLERPLDAPLAPIGDQSLTAVTYDGERNHERFAALLEATYAGSLDCPELNGVRTADEALAGHRGTGRFDPRLWTLYHAAGQDAGLMLVVEHPALRAREIVYMGVAPEARGRGVGSAMLVDALQAARAAGCETILLGVDVRNHVACALYERQGFVELCRRVIHFRVRR